jgi:hypothetical protein
MTYNPNVPAAGTAPSQSRAPIQTNFSQINTRFGVEHTALTGTNGKHKYITLTQTPGAPAPAGTELVLSQEVAFGTQYPRVINSAGAISLVPLVKNVFKVINIPGSSLQTIVDFSTLSIGHTAGTIFVFQLGHPTRSIFTTFFYLPGALSIPGTSPGWNGQLNSGSTTFTFAHLEKSGDLLQLKINGAFNDTVVTVITYTPS